MFSDVDSWMTAPRFHPTTPGVPAATLICLAGGYLTNSAIRWACADAPDLAIPGLNGVIARIMLAGLNPGDGNGTLNIQVAGRFSDQGGSWSETFTLVIPEPTTLSLLALGGLAGLIRRF